MDDDICTEGIRLVLRWEVKNEHYGWHGVTNSVRGAKERRG